MRICYSPGYAIPLPPRHPFPMGKYPALYRQLMTEGLYRPEDVIEPGEVAWADLRLVHSAAYLTNLEHGTLGVQAERRLGLPWSPELVRRARLAVQGTIDAARMALFDGIAANLAGGTHHAFPGHGEGFCVFNDVAVAIRVLAHSGWIGRALVVDLDVHQGNGTAAIFAGDTTVYTFSIHGARNYPFQKVPSTLDVALPDGTGDDAYLDALGRHLPIAIEQAKPDLVFFLAGVDVLAGDRFGRLALTCDGLRARDALVLETLHRAGLPATLLLSGGYAATPEATASYHAVAHQEARRIYR